MGCFGSKEKAGAEQQQQQQKKVDEGGSEAKKEVKVEEDGVKGQLASAMQKKDEAANEYKEVIKRLAKKDKNMTELIMNNMSAMQHDLASFSEIAKALKDNPYIINVELSNVGMKDVQCIEIAEALTGNKVLQKLNIESNALTGAAIKAVAAMVEKHPALRELRIDNQRNIIGVEAERSIANALSQNTNIIKLSMTCRDKSVKVYIDKFISRNQDLVRKARVSQSANKPVDLSVEKVPYPFPAREAEAPAEVDTSSAKKPAQFGDAVLRPHPSPAEVANPPEPKSDVSTEVPSKPAEEKLAVPEPKSEETVAATDETAPKIKPEEPAAVTEAPPKPAEENPAAPAPENEVQPNATA